MKQVQGLLLVGIALFLLWIGVTGRFEALIRAIGIVRGNPVTPGVGASGQTDVSNPTSSGPLDYTSTGVQFTDKTSQFGLNPSAYLSGNNIMKLGASGYLQ